MKLTRTRLENLSTANAALVIGALCCLAGLMSYPWRALIFLLWPDGPALLWNTAPKAVSILIYPGLHFASWLASEFPAGSGVGAGYLILLFSAVAGLLLNLILWASLAYAALRAAGSTEKARD